jgi:hypothetical protein
VSAPKALPAIFKGDANAYGAVHLWVKYHRGAPKLCESCGTTDREYYDWANISGEYKRDLSDWQRLCRSCHTMRDRKRELVWFKEFCSKGHRMVITNLYILKKPKKVGGYYLTVTCWTCKKEHRRRPDQLEKARQRAAYWRQIKAGV